MGKGKLSIASVALVVVLVVINLVVLASHLNGSGSSPVSSGTISVPDFSADPVVGDLVVSESTLDAEPVENTTTTTEYRQEYEIEFPYYIEVDKVGQTVTIFTTDEEGKYTRLVRQMICSTGQKIDKLPDGIYPLKDKKKEWCTMLSRTDKYLYAQYTTQITGSYLFHSVPYTKNGDHTSLSISRFYELGQAVSGGCIRLTVEGAKWIYDNCPAGTPVRVFKGEKFDAELIESLRPGDPEGGWDPTDPAEGNPNYRPIITTPDPEPYKYAPLYDYQWKWSKEVPLVSYSADDDDDEEETTTTAPEESEETDAPEETTTPESTETTSQPEETTAAAPAETTAAAPAETTTTAASSGEPTE